MEALGLNLGYLIVQVFSFLILVIILHKWAYTPVIEMLQKRRKTIAQAVKISSEILTGGDLPYINEVSASQTLSGERSALIYAKDVIDADGIGRVWAVITPPGYSSTSPETPVTELPMVDLDSVGNNRYETIYRGFVSEGTYNIAIFAAPSRGALFRIRHSRVGYASSIGTSTGELYLETRLG